MKIFETHAHYDDERFDEDRDELISSMLSDTGELDYIVNVGASRQGCEASLALAAQYEKVYAAIGYHPEDIVRLKESDICFNILLTRYDFPLPRLPVIKMCFLPVILKNVITASASR